MPAPRTGMVQGVRWVLFDAVGTLIYAEPRVAEVYCAAARRYGSALRPGEIGKRFAGALCAEQGTNRAELVRRPTSEEQERERWRRIVGAVIDDVPKGEGLFEELWEHFARAEHWRVYEDVAAALAELRKRGHQLGIASNFDTRLAEVIRGHAALQPIELAFVSSEIGYVKPDPRFFSAIEKRLNAAAAEIMLVGDDEVNDAAGAAAAGWRSVLLDRDGKCNAPNAIRSLDQLICAGGTPAAREVAL